MGDGWLVTRASSPLARPGCLAPARAAASCQPCVAARAAIDAPLGDPGPLRRLRQISKEQHEAILNIIAPSVLLDWARRLDLTEGKAIVLENDNEMTLPEDLAIYLPRPGRSHPLERYARVARFAPGSDEAIVLAAMRRARFSLWRVERRHPTTGLILRDLLRCGARRLGWSTRPWKRTRHREWRWRRVCCSPRASP